LSQAYPDPDPAASGGDDPTEYTADGSFLRLHTATREIDFPDGSTQRFDNSTDCHNPAPLSDQYLPPDHCWRMTLAHDRFGSDPNWQNYFTVSYIETGTNDPRWVISDSENRQHTVHFEAWPLAPGVFRVHQVDLGGFNGQTAYVRFNYIDRAQFPDCAPNTAIQRAYRIVQNGQWADPIPDNVNLFFLNSIAIQDSAGNTLAPSYTGLQYRNQPYGVVTEAGCNLGSGRLQQMTYPSGATVAWGYGLYYGPDGLICSEPVDEPGGSAVFDELNTWLGIATKTITAADGTTVLGGWTYETEYSSEAFNTDVSTRPANYCLHATRTRAGLVRDGSGTVQVTYQNQYKEDSDWSPYIPLHRDAASLALGWRDDENGQDFTRYNYVMGEPLTVAGENIAQQPLYMQSEVYDCTATRPSSQPAIPALTFSSHGANIGGGATSYWAPSGVANCTRKRATYVRYETDANVPNAGGTDIRIPMYAPSLAPGTAWTFNDSNLSGVVGSNGTPFPGACQSWVSGIGTSADPLVFTGGNCSESNRRVAESKTIYFDDGGTFSDTHSWDYDGLGHYRSTLASSNVGSSPQRLSQTAINASNDEYHIRTSSQSWILSMPTSTYRRDIGLNDTVQKEMCYDDATGFLRYERDYRGFDTDFKSPTAQSNAHDVLVGYQHDNKGYVTTVRTWGGDNQALPNGSLCTSTFEGRLNTIVPQYQSTHTYSAGVVTQDAEVVPTTQNSQPGAQLLVSVNNAVDRTTGLITSITDTAGIVDTASYDVLGRLTSAQHGQEPSLNYLYCFKQLSSSACSQAGLNGQNAVSITVQDVDHGNATLRSTTLFDDLGRTIETRVPYADTNGNLATRVSKTAYDSLGRKIADSVPMDSSVAASFTLPTTVPGSCDPSTNKASYYTYTWDNRIAQTRIADCSVVTMSYQGISHVDASASVQTGGGLKTATVSKDMDGYGRLIGVEESSGGTAANPQRMYTRYHYNSGDKLTQVSTYPTGVSNPDDAQYLLRAFYYDGLGHARESDVRELNFEPVVLSNLDSMGHAGQMTWGGNLRTSTNVYDPMGRVTQQWVQIGTDPSRLMVETFYARTNNGADKRAGKLVEMRRHNYVPLDPTNPGGDKKDFVVSMRYAYTATDGKLEKIQTVSVDADSAGRRTEFDAGYDSQYVYDDLDRVTSVQYPACDAYGCLQGQVSSLEEAIGYAGMTATSLSVGPVGGTKANLVNAGFYANGVPSSIAHHTQLGATVLQSFGLDANGLSRIASIAVSKGGSNLWNSGAYSYDPSGHLKGVGSDTFQYDLADRMTSASVGIPGGTATQQAVYDGYGNLTQLTSNGQVSDFVLDDANRLATTSATRFSYDDFGNLSSLSHPTTPAGDGSALYQQLNYQSDGLDEVSYIRGFQSATRDGAPLGASTKMGFVYDPNNRRVVEWDMVAGTEHWTLRGVGGESLRELDRDATGAFTESRSSVYFGSKLVATYVPHGATISEYHQFEDHLGSTRLVTDGTGAIAQQFVYLPFGQQVYSQDNENPTGESQRVQFTGQELDHNSADSKDDTDYMMARSYTPEYGRFISIDPIEGTPEHPQSWNRYAYVGNNPVSNTDPTGKKPCNPNSPSKVIRDFCSGHYGGTAISAGTEDSNASESNVPANSPPKQDGPVTPEQLKRLPFKAALAYSYQASFRAMVNLPPPTARETQEFGWKEFFSGLAGMAGIGMMNSTGPAPPEGAPAGGGSIRGLAAEEPGLAIGGRNMLANAPEANLPQYLRSNGIEWTRAGPQSEFNAGLVQRGASGLPLTVYQGQGYTAQEFSLYIFGYVTANPYSGGLLPSVNNLAGQPWQ